MEHINNILNSNFLGISTGVGKDFTSASYCYAYDVYVNRLGTAQEDPRAQDFLRNIKFGGAITARQCFVEHDAMSSAILLMLGFALYSLVWSIIGNNCSKVDQIWSITPFVYGWLFFFHYQLNFIDENIYSSRLFVICTLVTLWGLRLTFNSWRRGGYGNLISHEEDYRWEIIRKKINNSFLFFLFNVSFISFFQNALLMLIACPIYWVMKENKSFDLSNPLDLGLALMFIALLIMETVADQQQWNFQNYKYSIPADKRAFSESMDVRQGFLTSGLFKHCRHPNYFAEQAIWVVVYLFSVSFDQWLSLRSVGGVAILMVLFHFSMQFSEDITVSKYADYARYQSTTRKCFPCLLSMITSMLNLGFGISENTTMSAFVVLSIVALSYVIGLFRI